MDKIEQKSNDPVSSFSRNASEANQNRSLSVLIASGLVHDPSVSGVNLERGDPANDLCSDHWIPGHELFFLKEKRHMIIGQKKRARSIFHQIVPNGYAIAKSGNVTSNTW